MKVILLHVLLTVTILGFAQKKFPPPPLPPGLTKDIRTNTSKFSLQRRFSFYPFQKTSRIEVVSFGLQLDSGQRKSHENYQLPKLNDTICFSKLDQIKALTLAQIDTLTDIMYNECSRWNLVEHYELGCYYPRNAVLFFDNAGRVFEYMEICFECANIKLSSFKFVKPELCNYTYTRLENFFKRLGIKTSSYELRRGMK